MGLKYEPLHISGAQHELQNLSAMTDVINTKQLEDAMTVLYVQNLAMTVLYVQNLAMTVLYVQNLAMTVLYVPPTRRAARAPKPVSHDGRDQHQAARGRLQERSNPTPYTLAFGYG